MDGTARFPLTTTMPDDVSGYDAIQSTLVSAHEAPSRRLFPEEPV